MKTLGFSGRKAGPVVKRLLKLFNDNWEPIEEDNYSVLIEAILDDEKSGPMPIATPQGTEERRIALPHQGMTDQGLGPHTSTWVMPDYQNPSPSAPAYQYDMDASDNESPLIKRPRMSSADRVSLQPTTRAIMALPVVHQADDRGGPSAIVTCNRDKGLLLESPQDVLLLEEPKPESELDLPAAPGNKHLSIGEYGSSAPESSECTCQNWIVPYQAELLSKQRPPHDVADISKGEERVRIPIVNDLRNGSCPPLFYYIRKSLVFQSAYINTSLARIGDEDCCADCSSNCLLSSLPCACARSTGGNFAYTPEGLVRATFIDECIAVNHFSEKQEKSYCEVCPLERYKTEASPDPCKGHLARKFIKECWSKCGCGMQCGNRVIQQGIAHNLQVFLTSEAKGWGLRTVDGLPKGAFICEYVGEVLSSSELHQRRVEDANNDKHVHRVLLDATWGSEGASSSDEESLCLDPTFYGNVGRFVHHRCNDPNLVLIPVEVESPDRHYYHLAFFTAKKIEAFEELTWDYGIDFDSTDSTNKAFHCMCGSQYCRDPKNSRKRTRAAASGN
ncbi:unnamed protein product [Alopecurus aequalis]